MTTEVKDYSKPFFEGCAVALEDASKELGLIKPAKSPSPLEKISYSLLKGILSFLKGYHDLYQMMKAEW